MERYFITCSDNKRANIFTRETYTLCAKYFMVLINETQLYFVNQTLNTMPSVLVKAHQALDKAVDLCCSFMNETKRIVVSFELYDKYTSGMFGERKFKSKKVRTM